MPTAIGAASFQVDVRKLGSSFLADYNFLKLNRAGPSQLHPGIRRGGSFLRGPLRVGDSVLPIASSGQVFGLGALGLVGGRGPRGESEVPRRALLFFSRGNRKGDNEENTQLSQR